MGKPVEMQRGWGVKHLAMGAGVVALAGAVGIVLLPKAGRQTASAQMTITGDIGPAPFTATSAQLAALTLKPVEERIFRPEVRTEGKIALDEHRATRIFSPYAGRIKQLLAEPGDLVQQGQLLFVIEAADSVDTQKDFVAAVAALNKASSQVNLARLVEERMSRLIKEKAMPLKDWQEAQANLTAMLSDLRSAEIALQAVRNRLRLLGKTDSEIDGFESTGIITPDAPVYAPLTGTILQRNVGLGQYVNAGASDAEPSFRLGDVSRVWLIAYVRESDASRVKVGQPVTFTVVAHPGRVFRSAINYVASSIDPASRRLLIRASLDNAEGLLKPEMFASVSVQDADDTAASAAISEEAIIYEGNSARVWVAKGPTLESRKVRLGLRTDQMIQILDGLKPGESVVTRGSLFVDRAAGS